MAFNILHPLYPKLSINTSGNVVPHQSLTVSTVAIAFATAFNSNTNLVSFDVQGSDVRVRFDGTNPTSTVGHILPAGTAYTWDKDQAARAIFIRDTSASADATLFVSEYAG